MNTTNTLKLDKILFMLVLLAIACQKKDDPVPVIQTGQAVLWTASQTLGGSYIEVTIDNKYEGRITQFSNQAPKCGESGFVTVTKPAGTYPVSAVGQDGTKWSNGSITITAGSCYTLEFTGSNSTNGQVIFWTQTDLGCGNITVKVGSLTGVISGYVSGSPNCNAPNMPTFTLQPGNYSYTATCTGKNASGSFTIQSGGCLRVQLY